MLISKENLEKMLLLHPEDKRDLIRSQIELMTELILNNRKKYKSYGGYSDAIDDVLKLIMQGSFAEGVK